jgi:pimeloyl-ACP methyl ester carboxylesterase
MSSIEANGIHINYRIEGSGPWVTLSHSLTCDLSMWDDLAAALAPHFTVLRYDTRGHGAQQRAGRPLQLRPADRRPYSACSMRSRWSAPTSSACRWAA